MVNGTTDLIDTPDITGVTTDAWHYAVLEWSKNNGTLSLTIDSETQTTSSLVDGDFPSSLNGRMFIGRTGTGDALKGFCSRVEVLDSLDIVQLGYPLEEGSLLPYDTSGNENIPLDLGGNNATWATADGIPSWNHENGFTQVSNLYAITEPNGGYDRAYDPTTASLGESFDVLATLVVDLAGTVGSWTVTNPAGLRTFNPNTAASGIFMDVLSTIADDLPSTASVYTLTEPSGGRVRTYNPNLDSVGVAYDVLATILLDIQEAGLIGE
jgi:hypothetical protein